MYARTHHPLWLSRSALVEAGMQTRRFALLNFKQRQQARPTNRRSTLTGEQDRFRAVLFLNYKIKCLCTPYDGDWVNQVHVWMGRATRYIRRMYF